MDKELIVYTGWSGRECFFLRIAARKRDYGWYADLIITVAIRRLNIPKSLLPEKKQL